MLTFNDVFSFYLLRRTSLLNLIRLSKNGQTDTIENRVLENSCRDILYKIFEFYHLKIILHES